MQVGEQPSEKGVGPAALQQRFRGVFALAGSRRHRRRFVFLSRSNGGRAVARSRCGRMNQSNQTRSGTEREAHNPVAS